MSFHDAVELVEIDDYEIPEKAVKYLVSNRYLEHMWTIYDNIFIMKGEDLYIYRKIF